MQSSILEHFRKVEDVEEQEIQWVIPRWIPKGGITLLVGDGGIGKTNLWSYLVSRLSAGMCVCPFRIMSDQISSLMT